MQAFGVAVLEAGRQTDWRAAMGRKVFSGTKIRRGTVVLNWHGTPEKEFGFFARAFHEAAKDLVRPLRDVSRFGLRGGMDDFRAYPIVFMYRHSLELHLKAVILEGSSMLVARGLESINEERLLREHSLAFLAGEIERVFEAYEWEWDFGVEHLKSRDDFRVVIADLAGVDDRSFSFRYPVDTKGRASLRAHFRFDLLEFCEVLDGLLNGLDGAATAAYEELQARYGREAEEHQVNLENSEPSERGWDAE